MTVFTKHRQWTQTKSNESSPHTHPISLACTLILYFESSVKWSALRWSSWGQKYHVY